jgi:hypothetical protein
MSTAPQPPPVAKPPKCCFCKEDLVTVDEYHWGLLAAVACPHCHVLLHMQVLGVLAPREEKQDAGDLGGPSGSRLTQ